MVIESHEHVVLANESSQLQSSYEAAALLIEFELKKILIDKMDKSESYLTAPEHRECYDGLIKSYELDKNLLSTYDKVYSLKRIEKTMIKMITCLIFSLLYPDQGLKKRKTSKHAEPSKDRLILHKVEGNLGVDDGRTQERARTPQQGQSKLVMTLAVIQGRNKLMCSDELYKFSDGTLTRLRSSLDDITKNIRMKYLPKRRWSSLEKKRAHIMIKAIDKLLKQRRMMRSLEKCFGGRHYENDLRLLQRTI
ncbi:hypothetical protein Tco_0965510 [Tanacetum coccineum]